MWKARKLLTFWNFSICEISMIFNKIDIPARFKPVDNIYGHIVNAYCVAAWNCCFQVTEALVAADITDWLEFYGCVWRCLYLCVCVFVCLCVCVCMCVHLQACVYACVLTYVTTYRTVYRFSTYKQEWFFIGRCCCIISVTLCGGKYAIQLSTEIETVTATTIAT